MLFVQNSTRVLFHVCIAFYLEKVDFCTQNYLLRCKIAFSSWGLALNVSSITVDFEQGAYDAFRNVFGLQININGCFYHLTQSTFRKACELGLRQIIVDGSQQFRADIRMFVGMIDALAFVPAGHIYVAARWLINNMPDPVLLTPLVQYFMDNYVLGAVIPNQVPLVRALPLFPPAIWNMYQVTLQGGSRTNNICEGWNNSFNVLVGQQHPPP